MNYEALSQVQNKYVRQFNEKVYNLEHRIDKFKNWANRFYW